MALPEENLVTVLNAASAVTDIVGSEIFPVSGDQSATKPYVSFNRVSTVPVGNLKSDAQPFGMVMLQVMSWGRNYTEGKQLAAAVRAALDAETSTVFRTELDLVDVDGGPYVFQEYSVYTTLD